MTPVFTGRKSRHVFRSTSTFRFVRKNFQVGFFWFTLAVFAFCGFVLVFSCESVRRNSVRFSSVPCATRIQNDSYTRLYHTPLVVHILYFRIGVSRYRRIGYGISGQRRDRIVGRTCYSIATKIICDFLGRVNGCRHRYPSRSLARRGTSSAL